VPPNFPGNEQKELGTGGGKKKKTARNKRIGGNGQEGKKKKTGEECLLKRIQQIRSHRRGGVPNLNPKVNN